LQLDDGTPVQMPANFAPVVEQDGSLCFCLDGELVAKKAPDSSYFDRMIELSSTTRCHPSRPSRCGLRERHRARLYGHAHECRIDRQPAAQRRNSGAHPGGSLGQAR
jgi:hypothetical protein